MRIRDLFLCAEKSTVDHRVKIGNLPQGVKKQIVQFVFLTYQRYAGIFFVYRIFLFLVFKEKRTLANIFKMTIERLLGSSCAQSSAGPRAASERSSAISRGGRGKRA